MTRPRKQTVDYFPHSCDHGETMFILEHQFGNDGYTFWFKLLERLGKSDGHYLDLNRLSTWEFLASKTRIEPDKCTEILNLLARLDAIDPELWESRIVWSDNFVLGLADVYKKRVVEIPQKPLIGKPKPVSSGVSGAGNPQSKVKESRVKESKVITPRKSKKSETPIPDDFGISPGVKAWADAKGYSRLEDHLESFRDYAKSRGKTYADWDSAFKRAIREDWAKLGQGPQRQLSKADQITAGNLAARERAIAKIGGE